MLSLLDRNVFEGGFLGLDNIGPIDRSIQRSLRWRTLRQVTASPSKIGDIARAGRCYLDGPWGGEVLGALAVAVHTAVPGSACAK